MNSTQLANLNRLKKIASGGGGGGQVDTSYVDAQDAKTLSEAKSYTDTAISSKADSEHTHDEYLPLAGGTMTGELRVNGGDKMGGSKIVLTTGKGQITNSGTQTLFGFTGDTTLAVGHGSYILALRGNTTRPKYNSKDLAFQSDIPDLSEKANTSDLTSHTGNTTIHVTSAEKTKWNNKMNDMTIELYNGTGGNPKPVRFASFNYSTCSSEHGLAVKISMVSGHGNGTSYAFLQDVIIRVSYSGGVEVDNLKYYGASTGTYDGANRQYGDIFWLFDTTNSAVDFYCLMGQYARVYQSPWKRLTYSTGGTVTQYTSCTVYASGEKNWANNSEIATLKDLESSGIIYSEATQLSSGLMSASDKKKLDGIATGANNTTVDDTLYSWSTNPVQNKVVTDALSKKADGTTLNSHTGNTTVHITSAERTKWNNKSNFSGNYNDLTNKPTIPSVPVQSVNGKTGAVQLTASDVGALSTSGGTSTGTIVAPVFKSDSTDSAIKCSDSNEINFGSNGDVIFFGYDNRVGSPGAVHTYRFGTHSGSAGSTKGNIVCGSVMEDGVLLSNKYASISHGHDGVYAKPPTTAHVVLYGDRWDGLSSGYTQVVTDSRITADALLLVGPEPSAVRMYGQYGVVCTSQGNGTLTFTASVKPTTALGVNIFILG